MQSCQKLISTIESEFIQLIRIQDELTLKTILDGLRHLIHFFKQSETIITSIYNLDSLSSIINLKDDNDDFFTCFLAIKMKQR